MPITIDAPGLAKLSAGDRMRDIRNEERRTERRLEKANRKLTELRMLKKDLPLYLQPGDYERLEKQLKREVARMLQERNELSHERHAAQMALWAASRKQT
jgi:hypothetical protein